MKATKLPYFRRYVADWLLDHRLRHSTAEVRGIVHQLECEMWHNEGSLPADHASLRRFAGASEAEWERSGAAALQYFEHTNSIIFDPKLKQQMTEAAARQAKQSEAGKRGMQTRWADKQKEQKPEEENTTGINVVRYDIDLQRDAVDEVWNYYLAKTGRDSAAYEFTDARRLKGLARFRDCMRKTDGDWEKATKLMKAAVDGLAASGFHMGRDAKTNGKRYIEWEKHLFKSYEQMEGWWNQ